MSQSYLPTNYPDHDQASSELFEIKSLDALVFLIDHGRELEFRFHNQDYFLSCSGSKQYISLWENSTEQSFGSMREFLETAVLQDTPFLSAWEVIELKYLF